MFMVVLSPFGHAKATDEIEEALQRRVEAAAKVTSLSYEINAQQADLTNDPKKWNPNFIFRYWWQAQQWRAERFEIINGKENPAYVEAFNGKQYQLLDFNTGQLKLASSAIPLPAAPRHSYYDNAPLALLQFLEFENRLSLPSFLEAAPLGDVLSWKNWTSFFTSATVETSAAGSPNLRLYRIVNAHLGGERFSNYSKVEFDPAVSLFPKAIARIEGVGQDGGTVNSMRVSDTQQTQLTGFEMPKDIIIDYYSNLKTHELLYERKVQISNIKVNAKIPDSIFNVDLNLASEIWDMDNRVSFATESSGKVKPSASGSDYPVGP
jgi:hypothetical protein